ncbi:hypothetical protein [Zobellella maritima]|uniref:hypothetical protein n=1 Tax=Zobellella maritima TaxID=2059725 RepID=UPI001300A10B|nr:hypothetical protein [Zobellella maritima]
MCHGFRQQVIGAHRQEPNLQAREYAIELGPAYLWRSSRTMGDLLAGPEQLDGLGAGG